jgi:hypothetical protein
MPPNEPPPASSNLTLRAFLIGLVACAIIGAEEPWGVGLVHGSPMAADFATGSALFLLLLLVAGNALVRRLRPRLALSPVELVSVYAMMIVACSVVSWGFMMNLLSLMPGPAYFQSPSNGWADTIIPNLNPALVIGDEAAARGFYEGLRPGQHIPWGLWAGPLARWVLFAIALYGATTALAYIVRRQWVTNERLIFPLTQLPLAMAQIRQPGETGRPLLRNRLLWAGFAVPFVYHGVNALHGYFPVVPALFRQYVFVLFRRSTPLIVWLFWEVVGLSYLLTTDVSFSVWFWTVLTTLEMGVLYTLGIDREAADYIGGPGRPSIAYQGMGAMIAMVALLAWRARRHLGEVWRSALSGRPAPGQGGGSLSYRFAILVAVGGTAYALWWLCMSGLPPVAAVLLLAIELIVFVGLSRIVAQAGLAYARPPVSVPHFVTYALGSTTLGKRGVAALGLVTSWGADIKTHELAAAANALKMSDAAGLADRRLFWAMMLAILAGFAGTIYSNLALAYGYGATTLGGWHMQSIARAVFGWVGNVMDYPVEVSGKRFIYMGIGAALFLAVSAAKDRWMWFPLHPIVMPLGLCYQIATTWFSVFLAWAAKAVILRYWGGRGHQAARPFFLGLILGSFTAGGFWLIVDFFFGGRGNVFTNP